MFLWLPGCPCSLSDRSKLIYFHFTWINAHKWYLWSNPIFSFLLLLTWRKNHTSPLGTSQSIGGAEEIQWNILSCFPMQSDEWNQWKINCKWLKITDILLPSDFSLEHLSLHLHTFPLSQWCLGANNFSANWAICLVLKGPTVSTLI